MLRNGAFWTWEWAVLDVSLGRFGLVFFSSIGAVLVSDFQWAVYDLHWGRFGRFPDSYLWTLCNYCWLLRCCCPSNFADPFACFFSVLSVLEVRLRFEQNIETSHGFWVDLTRKFYFCFAPHWCSVTCTISFLLSAMLVNCWKSSRLASNSVSGEYW